LGHSLYSSTQPFLRDLVVNVVYQHHGTILGERYLETNWNILEW